jgi:hypothetical protein
MRAYPVLIAYLIVVAIFVTSCIFQVIPPEPVFPLPVHTPVTPVLDDTYFFAWG